MTFELASGELVIKEEAPGKCELCGAFEELRPYGPNGERICWDCGQKNLGATERAFNARLEKASKVIFDPTPISILH